jgi:dGTPase
VTDCVSASLEAASEREGGRVALSAEVLDAIDTLREFMFERVYLVESTVREARRGQAVVRALFTYYESHPDRIPGWSLPDDPPWRRAADYVSGMTDGYAARVATDLDLIERTSA